MNGNRCPSDPRFVGDPVDTLTGAVVDRMLEFRLTGHIELRWNRHYDSSLSHRQFSVGTGCAHEYDRSLSLDAEGVSYEEPVGRSHRFPLLNRDGEGCAAHGLYLRRVSATTYRLSRHAEPTMEFVFPRNARGARLTRLLQGSSEVRFWYDDAQKLVRIDDSAGRFITANEDEARRLVRLAVEPTSTKPGFLLVEYRYDQRGNLIATKNDQGHGYAFTYDDANRMVLRRGRKGFQFYFKYDAQGRCIHAMGDDAIYGVALDYKVLGRVTKVTRPDGGVWIYTFTARGELQEVVDPLGGVQKFVRDSSGRQILEIDPNGNASTFLYDPAGEAVAKVDSMGRRISLPEDPNAPDPFMHRVAANSAEYEYGRLLTVDDIELPDETQTENLPLSRDVRLLISTRSNQTQSPASGQEFEVPPLRVNWWPDPKSGRIFNDFGKLVQQRDEFRRLRHWTYDPSGNVSTFTDFDGRSWSYDNGSWHLLRGVVDPLGAEGRFTYTTNEQIASFTDAGGTLSEYGYDVKDHLVEIKRHGVVREKYSRDVAGNLTEKCAGDGRPLLQFEIGPGNLLVKRTLASGDEHTFEYDKSGRYLVSATKKDLVEFAYDGFGNAVLEKRNGLGVEHCFQGWQHLAESVFFNRFLVRYEWPKGNRLVITDPGGKSHDIRFHDRGLIERRLSNGSKETSQYDNLGRCLFKCAHRTGGQVWSRRYHWSGEGELQRVEDNIRGDVRYEFDAAHRLQRRTTGGRVEKFEMDLAGNLLRQPGLQQATHQSGNRLHTVDGFPVSYNDRNHIEARRTADGPARYTYDSRDQLVRVDGPRGAWTAEYDTLARRTRKTWAGQTTEYYWNGDQLIAEATADGSLRLYLYADLLAVCPFLFLDYDSVTAPVDSCRRYFVFTDQIGTPCSVEDESGAEVWRAFIDPFGNADVASGAKIDFYLRFPGHYFDPELGLHYNRFRYYDPRLGRYLQSDPWGISGGYNLYAYRSNPLLQSDVRGLGEENLKKGKACPDEESNKPLQDRKGWVGEYGKQKKVTGDGSVDRDHQPSKLAIKKAMQDDIDARVAAGEMDKPSPAQMKEINARIDKEGLAVVVDHDVHKEGPTHGNKNKAQSDIDKQDLGAAAARDADAMVANTAKIDPDNLPATQAAADKIKEQTHEGIMEKNREIVDDVMSSDD